MFYCSKDVSLLLLSADVAEGKVKYLGDRAKFIYILWFHSGRHQDVHNQSYIMVMASGRWLGVRLDVLASLLIGAVSLAAVLVSQDAGRCICKANHSITTF